MDYFNVKDGRTIKKFINLGLKVIPIGKRDYRFKKEDLEEFTERLKETAQEEMLEKNPIRKKVRSRTVNIDYQKRKINLEQNKVI